LRRRLDSADLFNGCAILAGLGDLKMDRSRSSASRAYLLCSSKKGISSHKLHRTLGVTYKSAWFLTHRIREAMKDTSTVQLGGEGTNGIIPRSDSGLWQWRAHQQEAKGVCSY
jgi:hypothetical protein